MKVFFVVALVGLCLASSSDDRFTGMGNEVPKPITLKKGGYVVTIIQRKGDPRVDSGMYQGYYCGVVVKDIQVAYKGVKCEMPRSLFADLATIHDPSLKVKGKVAELRFGGSDAGEGYDCWIKLVEGAPTMRIIKHGESHQWLEELRYNNAPISFDN